jgi:hypothetical protein
MRMHRAGRLRPIKQRGLSSAGRAVALQASGHRFDPDRLHQFSWRKRPADDFSENSRAGESRRRCGASLHISRDEAKADPLLWSG